MYEKKNQLQYCDFMLKIKNPVNMKLQVISDKLKNHN